MAYRRDHGLAEIIGFILILAGITIAVALYAIYGVPAQGREGEITQMNTVRDRFVEFKVDLDSLWSNRQCGTPFATSFTLGTGGAGTTGSFSIIPILEPVKTSATLALDQRTEYITIAQQSYFMVTSGGYNETGTIGTIPGTTITFNRTPMYFFINISTPDLLSPHGVHIYPSTGSAWDAWVNTTPVYSFYRNLTIVNGSYPYYGNITYAYYYTNVTPWNRTDITVSTMVGGIPVIQGFIADRNIAASTGYVVDLMKPSYGISSALGSTISPLTITANATDTTISATYITNYSYWPGQTSQTWNMGSLEYRGQNQYWVCQTYYYQMGGIFLEQNDGNAVKVPPAISFSMLNGTTPVVTIDEILLSGSGIIQGTGPVLVTSSIGSITDTQLAPGNNTQFVNLTVDTLSNNAAMAWNYTLLTAANQAGFPASIYTMNTGGAETYMNISPSSSIYGIQLALKKVVVNSALQTATPPGS